MQETRLTYLLDQWLQENISTAEKKELAVLVEENKNTPIIPVQLAQLMDKELAGASRQPMADRERILSAILSIDKNDLLHSSKDVLKTYPSVVTTARHIHFLKTAWFRYAAAVVLIAGVTIAYFIIDKPFFPAISKNQKILVETKDIAPGYDKAILTLANGQQIPLDSAQGNIVQQGNLMVVNGAGKLDYKGIGTNMEYHTLTTPKGGQYQLVLPDGSKVWLNAASSITYPTAFAEKNRTVTITGEVYFEIVKNVKIPFHVNVNNETAIDVLGTSFNVKAYKEDGAFKTSLIEGSIKVNNQVLQPGQADINGKLVKTDIAQDIAWKNGTFNFYNLKLDAAMRQLSRWYNIEIVYEKGIPDIEFAGEMSRNLPLSDVLWGLKGIGVHFRMEEGRRLIVTP